MMAAGLPLPGSSPGTPAATSQRDARRQPRPEVTPGSPAYAAAQRFAALAPSAGHAWLVQHLAALRAGRITVAQLP